MAQLVAPDGACVEMQVGNRIYRQDKGVFNVENPKHARLMRAAGCFVKQVGFQGVRGYVCPECGHKSLFRRCKCGAECTREEK